MAVTVGIGVLAGEALGVFAKFLFWELPDRDPLGAGRRAGGKPATDGQGQRSATAGSAL